jgi:hypothetical protein
LAAVAKYRNLVIFAALFSLYGYFIHFWPTFHAANESIRFYFVQAVVDHGQAEVDPILERYKMRNVDSAKKDGHYYMDKAPGLSLWVLPLYWVMSKMGVSTEFIDLPLLYHLLHLFGVVFPAVLGLWWAQKLVLHWTGNERGATAAAIVMGLATPFAIYATLFFGHAPAAALAIGSLYYLEKDRPILAGVLAGWMVLVDTPTALLALILGLYAGLRNKKIKPLIAFGLGGLPFVAAQLAYNAMLFGSPLTFAYAMKSSPELAAIIDEGMYGFSWPSMAAIWGLSFGGMRGLFFHAPVLLLAAWGLRLLFQTPGRQAQAWLVAVASGAYFLWIAAFVDWPAGASYAPRHLTPIIPFLAILVGVAFANYEHHRWFAWSFAGLLIASVIMAWSAIATFPYAPNAFTQPVSQLALPLLSSLHLSPNMGRLAGLSEWASLVPPALIGVGLLCLVHVGKNSLAAFLGIVIVSAVVWFGPVPIRKETLNSRVGIECLLDYEKGAEALCNSEDKGFDSRRCRCVQRRSLPR